MIYLTLIYEFMKIGLFAVGGGLATLPFLTALADKYYWLTSDMLTQMIAVSESTPGPLGVNMATYAGYMAGMGAFAGNPVAPIFAVTTAFTATAALVTPSFIIIIIIGKFLDKYKNSRLVENAFSGLRPVIAGLIAAAAWAVIGSTLFNFKAWNGLSTIMDVLLLPEIVFFALLMLATNVKPMKKLHPLFFIAIAAVVGIGMGYAFNW